MFYSGCNLSRWALNTEDVFTTPSIVHSKWSGAERRIKAGPILPEHPSLLIWNEGPLTVWQCTINTLIYKSVFNVIGAHTVYFSLFTASWTQVGAIRVIHFYNKNAVTTNESLTWWKYLFKLTFVCLFAFICLEHQWGLLHRSPAAPPTHLQTPAEHPSDADGRVKDSEGDLRNSWCK